MKKPSFILVQIIFILFCLPFIFKFKASIFLLVLLGGCAIICVIALLGGMARGLKQGQRERPYRKAANAIIQAHPGDMPAILDGLLSLDALVTPSLRLWHHYQLAVLYHELDIPEQARHHMHLSVQHGKGKYLYPKAVQEHYQSLKQTLLTQESLDETS